MDIATHDEVPKEKRRYSRWMKVENNSMFEDHSPEIELFVNCYLAFEGKAGKCHECFAREACFKLTKGMEIII